MNIKRYVRLVLLVCMIAIAAAIPVPMKFFSKDDLPKNLTEQIDTKEDDEEEDDTYEIS